MSIFILQVAKNYKSTVKGIRSDIHAYGIEENLNSSIGPKGPKLVLRKPFNICPAYFTLQIYQDEVRGTKTGALVTSAHPKKNIASHFPV